MTNDELRDFQQWLQTGRLPKQLQDVISNTANVVDNALTVVGGLVSIVGIFDAFVKLADLLGLNSQGPDRLELIAEAIQRIETKVNSIARWDTNAHWDDTLAPVSTASAELSLYVRRTNVAAGPRRELLTDADRDRLFDDVIRPLLIARFQLLPEPGIEPAYQQAFFSSIQDYGRWPWALAEHDKEERVDPVALGVTGLPALDPDHLPEWLGSTPEGGLVWDYRRALPHIVRIVTELVAGMKVYDPAMRTTQRFQDDLNTLIGELDVFAARWFSSIGWTHKLPLDPKFPDSDFPRSFAPTAFDSRARIQISFFDEFPNVNYWMPVPQEPVFSMSRLKYAQQVLVFSGFNDFRAWIDRLRQLTALPTESESVSTNSGIVGIRRFRSVSTFQRMGVMTPVKFFRVDWINTVDLHVQPQNPPYDYARNRPIHYEFFLESYESEGMGGESPQARLQQVRLRAGGEHRLSIRVLSRQVFVPAEDDGSFGDTSHIATPPPEIFGLGHESNSPIVQDFLKDASALSRNRPGSQPTDPKLANSSLDALGRLASRLSETGLVANDRPPKAEFVGGELTSVEIGYQLDVGTDIRNGIVGFRAWTLEGERNAGALYFVVEETPPADPSQRIRTALPIYLNPDEIWYPAFNRRGRSIVR